MFSVFADCGASSQELTTLSGVAAVVCLGSEHPIYCPPGL